MTGEHERGAVIPLVAVALVVLLGVVSLVVDLGHGWLTRQVLVAATDAAALAAAQDLAAGGDGCAATAAAYLAANDDDAVLDSCVPHTYDAVHGRVLVTASHSLDPGFAAVLGQDELTVGSTSAALWAPPAAVTGIRPIGLCYHASADLRRFIDDPTPTSDRVVVWMAPEEGSACEGTYVNWAALDFDGGSFVRDEIEAWALNGYPEPVAFSPHAITDCGGDLHCYHGELSSLWWLGHELDHLRDSGHYVTLPVFDRADEVDDVTLFHLVGVVRARIVDFRLGSWDDRPYLLLDIKPGVVTGTCCGDGAGAGGNRVVGLCAVDPDDLSACATGGS
ncbi:MAG: pilus assembly protein TadG-related protein [Acidimicrobiales bacterium]